MRTLLALASTLLLTAPGAANAEVSDKLATIPELWVTSVAAGALLFLLSRLWVRVGLILLPVTAFMAYVVLEPTFDPYVGPAILTEQGRTYFWVAYAAAILLVTLHVLGLWLGHRRRHAAA